MKGNVVQWLVMAMLPALAAGCSLLNPYQGEFPCPQAEKGKCQPLKAAYEDSLKKCPGGNCGNTAAAAGRTMKEGIAEAAYQQEVFATLRGLLEKPRAPMTVPPKVMRVLLLPYRGDANELYMARYLYFFSEDPRWIMGEYLFENDAD